MSPTESQASLHNCNSESSAQERAVPKRFEMFRYPAKFGHCFLVTYNGSGQTTKEGASLRIAPLFETGDSRYVWLTRLRAMGVGERAGTTVKYNIYALK